MMEISSSFTLARQRPYPSWLFGAKWFWSQPFGTRAWWLLSGLLLSLPGCGQSSHTPRKEPASPTFAIVQRQDVTLTQRYIGQVRPDHLLQVRMPADGYLEDKYPRTGQTVQKGDPLFRMRASGTENKPDTELVFKAPFEGELHWRHTSHGSFVERGDEFATLSDDRRMRVYFPVPEAQYLEYRAAHIDRHPEDFSVEIELAKGEKFDQPGQLAAIGGDFDPSTGHITFRADFPNPQRQLHAGQTVSVLVHQIVKDALVIPQRATFEVDGKRYVDLVGADDVPHPREIVLQHEFGESFTVQSGLQADDKIVAPASRW